jgi:hypothetical protein
VREEGHGHGHGHGHGEGDEDTACHAQGGAGARLRKNSQSGPWPPSGAARHPWTAPGTSRGRKSGTREHCSKGYIAGDKEAKRDLVRTWQTATGPDRDLAAEEHGRKDESRRAWEGKGILACRSALKSADIVWVGLEKQHL